MGDFLADIRGVVVECSYLFELSNQILFLFLVDCEIVSSEIKGLLLLFPSYSESHLNLVK